MKNLTKIAQTILNPDKESYTNQFIEGKAIVITLFYSFNHQSFYVSIRYYQYINGKLVRPDYLDLPEHFDCYSSYEYALDTYLRLVEKNVCAISPIQ